jgi:hypothetical protein
MTMRIPGPPGTILGGRGITQPPKNWTGRVVSQAMNLIHWPSTGTREEGKSHTKGATSSLWTTSLSRRPTETKTTADQLRTNNWGTSVAREAGNEQ